ncbi:hypothetical protein roselon_02303 [Roseibacterium elongatum DSM 19469]|uniref:Uncharacterized protein n=1 Tax=Roseicyclus elongatus DSM 19469 TaxID=1294273 RepID=W8RTU4_9RHOB|nr:hypothetical protein roselon_02303 [Roseibacterium elongatum DSM 19469]
MCRRPDAAPTPPRQPCQWPRFARTLMLREFWEDTLMKKLAVGLALVMGLAGPASADIAEGI